MSQAPLAASLPTTAAPAAGGMTNTVAPTVATDAFAEMFAIALKAVMNPSATGGATSLESVLQNITTQIPNLPNAAAVSTDGLLPQPITLPPEMMQELEKINFESLPDLNDLASQIGIELPQLELPETESPKIELPLPVAKTDVAQAFTAPAAAELIQAANLASNLDATVKPVAATSAQAILAAVPANPQSSDDAGEIDLASLSIEINEDEINNSDDFSNELPPAIVPDLETLSLVAPRDVAQQIITASNKQQATAEPVAVQQPNPALEDLAKKIVARMLSSTAPVAPSVNIAAEIEEVEPETQAVEPQPLSELATSVNPFPTIVVPTNAVETEPSDKPELPNESRSANVDAISAAQILASAGSSVVVTPTNEVAAASPSPLAIGSIDAADLEVSISASTLASIGDSSILPEDLGISSTNVSLEDVEAMLGRKVSDLPPPAAIIASAETSVEGASLSDQNAAVLANIDRVEFVDRMSQALRRAHLQSPKALELELHPPALGKVIIQVVNENGQMTARIEAHSQAARNLLLDNMPGLERNLGDHGITFQRLAVEQPQSNAQTGNQQQGSPDQRQGQPNSQQQNSQQQRQQGSNEQRSSAPIANDVEEGSRRKPITMSDLLAMAPGMDRTI